MCLINPLRTISSCILKRFPLKLLSRALVSFAKTAQSPTRDTSTTSFIEESGSVRNTDHKVNGTAMPNKRDPVIVNPSHQVRAKAQMAANYDSHWGSCQF